MRNPLFSIIIPTRDRPEFFRYSFLSAVNQDFDDFEVVVSDNSTDNRTQDVFREIYNKLYQKQKSKVVYIRTSKPLDMGSSWEFALRHARGKWIAFLGDDDCLTPIFLKKGYEFIQKFGNDFELIGIIPAHYIFDRNNLLFMRREFFESQQYEVVESSYEFKRVFEWFPVVIIRPHFAFVDINLYRKIREKIGKVFLPFAPDVSAGLMLLYYTKKFLRINIPLSIWGESLESYGVGTFYSEKKIKEFLNQFDENFEFRYSPVKSLVLFSIVFETMMRTVEKIAEAENKTIKKVLDEHGVSWRDTMRRFFIETIKNIEEMISHGEKKYSKELKKVKIMFALWKIKEFSKGILFDRNYVSDVVISRMRKIFNSQKEVVKNKDQKKFQKEVVKNKDQKKFNNIYEASIWLSNYIMGIE